MCVDGDTKKHSKEKTNCDDKNCMLGETMKNEIDVIFDDFYKTTEAKCLAKVSDAFRCRINNIKKTIQRIYPDLEADYKKDAEQYEKVISTFIEIEKIHSEFDEESLGKILEAIKKSKIPFPSVFEKAMFLSIFSELDAFTGEYLTCLYRLRPETIYSNEKQFEAKEVFECDSIEIFKEKVIQKEIDTIRRESYIEQINILENKFKLSTLKKFDNWGKYVEITQRRNIIMHCDGAVSEQYYNACKSNGHILAFEIGDKLPINYEYLIEAIAIIEEVSIKLVQILWRKCFTNADSILEFDDILNQNLYDLLVSEEWEIARALGYNEPMN